MNDELSDADGDGVDVIVVVVVVVDVFLANTANDKRKTPVTCMSASISNRKQFHLHGEQERKKSKNFEQN